MRADPEPHQIVAGFHRERAIAKPDAHRPEFSDFLETQRRMLRVLLQQRVVLIGQLSYLRRELF
jgi:hypothetical protein